MILDFDANIDSRIRGDPPSGSLVYDGSIWKSLTRGQQGNFKQLQSRRVRLISDDSDPSNSALVKRTRSACRLCGCMYVGFISRGQSKSVRFCGVF